MKLDWSRKYTTIAVYAFLVIVASICAYSLFQNFEGFSKYTSQIISLVTPFIYGFAIAYILNPVLRMFDDKFLPWVSRNRLKAKPRRVISILLTYLVAALVLVVFFAIVIPEVIFSISGLVQRFPAYLLDAEKWLSGVFLRLEEWGVGSDGAQMILNRIYKGFDELLNEGYQILTNALGYALNALPFLLNATKQFADGILNGILGIIISIYILMSKERFTAQIKKTLYALFPIPTVERSIYIAHKSHTTFSGFINGKLLDSLIIGILCFICMTAMKMPNVMLVSLIVGVTNVIPYFGPFIGAIPSTIIILLTSPTKAVVFVLFILLLQQFDGNILGPKILGESTGLSAFWVIFSILVFSGILGLLGMFIGVPLFAVIYTLFREFVENRLKKKELPTKTKDYASSKHPMEF